MKHRWIYTKNINIDGYTAFTSYFPTTGDNLTVSNGGIGWKSVLYQSLKHKAELKLSGHLRKCSMLDLLLFFLGEISEQLSRKVTTEEPNEGL